MKVLIVGSLDGRLTAATKLALDKGATVAHAADIGETLAALRAGLRAPTCWSSTLPSALANSSAGSKPSTSTPRSSPAAPPLKHTPLPMPSVTAPKDTSPCPPIPN